MKSSMPDLPVVEVAPGWAERHSGWILSFCFHIVLFVILLTRFSQSQYEQPKSIQLRVIARMEQMEPAREQVALTALPARATDSPAPSMEAARHPSAQTARQVEPDIVRQDDQTERIQNLLAEYERISGPDRQAIYEERTDISKRLEKAALQAAAYPHFPGYQGARVGAIRTLTLDNVEPAIARQVMDRYDIRISNQYVSEPNSSRSYLNSAATGGSVYTPANRAGIYEVFEITPKAYRQMVLLEQNWLVGNGYDPRATRVDTVEFGIVRKSGEFYDLGILNINVQVITNSGGLEYYSSSGP